MILILAICALLGGAFSSFGYALGVRFLKYKKLNKAILLSQSRCDKCHKKLTAFELVPIFSYIFLLAKCKKCKSKIDFKCFLFEILGAIFSVFCFIKLSLIYPQNMALLLLLFLLGASAILLTLSLIDTKLFAVPSSLLYVCVILLSAFGVITQGVITSFISGFLVLAGFWFICFALSAIKKQSVSGSADMWLIFGIAAALGILKAIIAIYIAALLSLVFMVAFKSTKSAFIPFLSLGFYLDLLFDEIIKSVFF